MAAVASMMLPISSSPNEIPSRGAPCNSRIGLQSRSNCTFMERFFSWSDTVFCPHHTTDTDTISFSKPNGKKPNNDEMLEYVFENGESFTYHHDPTNDDHNSEVEQGQGHKRALQQSSDPDLLDFFFDHVQSLVCTDDTNETVVLAAPIPTVPVVVGSPHPSRKKRSLTTKTTTTTRIGNHRGANKTRRGKPTTATTQTAHPTTTTASTSTKYYGLYQEGIVPMRTKKLKINAPTNNRTGIVSC